MANKGSVDAAGVASKVICIGECMIEISNATDSGNLGFAGDSLNFAVYLSRILGPGSVAYATRIGDDQFSSQIVGFMAKENIDTTLVARIPGRLPGLYMITTEGGERFFHYWRSEAPAREMLSESEPELEDALQNSRCLVSTGITMAILGDTGRESLCRCMERNDSLVAYLVNHRPRLWPGDEARIWHKKAAAAADIVFVSDDDLDELWPDGDGVAKLAEGKEKEIVVTKGDLGCQVIQSGNIIAKCGAVKSKVVDTTAAGDSCAAGYMAGKLMGKDTEECLKQATLLAGTVIGHHGAIIPREEMPV